MTSLEYSKHGSIPVWWLKIPRKVEEGRYMSVLRFGSCFGFTGSELQLNKSNQKKPYQIQQNFSILSKCTLNQGYQVNNNFWMNWSKSAYQLFVYIYLQTCCSSCISMLSICLFILLGSQLMLVGSHVWMLCVTF